MSGASPERAALANPESHWERQQPAIEQARARAVERLGPLTEPLRVLSGGLANLNLCIGRERVLRIYERDPGALAREAACLGLAWSALRVPRVLERGPDFLVLEYVPHSPLGGEAEHGRAIGRALAEIHSRSYPECGFLGPDLGVQPLGDVVDALMGFVDAQIAGGAATVLGDLARRAVAHLERHRFILEAGCARPAMLHGDFKVSNLHWTARGPLVLDWEFAYAGPIWSDVGQILRWSPPRAFVDAFADAYRSAAQGVGPPPLGAHWRETAELFDLIALIGLCRVAAVGSRRARDLRARIAAALATELPRESRASVRPPPLRDTGLLLGRDGSFTHEGQPIANPRLRRLLERSVRFLDGERAFVVQVGPFRGRIELEDTPFFVRAYDADRGEVWLSDQTRERLEPETLESDPEGVLRCRVKGRFAARFTRSAQAHLLDALDLESGSPRLRAGSQRVPVPQLAV